MELVCPKCHGRMRPHERQGVVIDLCVECRGIYLDRGELDRLLDLEAEADGSSRGFRSAAGVDRARDVGWRRDRDDDDDDWDERRGTPRRRRGGFLGELFEGFGD